ncbi:MAG: HAD-IA family hydrolase [Bacteroidaceae bacterium]|nr:HAD-IA family hydrolase [Bacteroidaceae bacterium]
MKQYENYIFDLDGTLLDTLGDLHAAVNHALVSQGLEPRTREEIRRMVGNGVTTLVERAMGEAGLDFNALFASFSAYYAQHSMDTTAPYAGVMDMLRRLRERGCRIAVVSNKVHSATVPLCRHFFGDLIDVAMGENEAAGIRRKPAPDMVFAAMREMGVTEAVYVGDSDVDIDTARAAGLPCISVLWGFRERELLEAHGASCFAQTPDDIV